MSDKIAFQADVSKMLDIVINSLYSEKQIFLRELISNASDACDKLKYWALTNPQVAEFAHDFKIIIKADEKANTLTISDNGIGMKPEELDELRDLISGRVVKDDAKGFGIANVEKRLEMLYGARYGMTVESEYTKGTKVTVRIPKV